MSEKPVVNNYNYDVDDLWISWCLTPEKMEIKYEDTNKVEYVVSSPWDNDSMISGHQNLTMYLHAKQFNINKLKAQLKEAESVIEFYADARNYTKTGHVKHYRGVCKTDESLIGSTSFYGGKRAREYKTKYMRGEDE